MAFYELRKYDGNERVWLGKYENLHNLPHWHYDCEFIYVEEGKSKVFVGGEEYNVVKGDGIFVDSGQIHSIEADSDSLLALFLFSDALVKDIISNTALKSPLLKNGCDVESVVKQIDFELTEKSLYYTTKVENIMTDMIIDIFRREETEEKKAEKNAYVAQYKALLKDIDEKYTWYTFSDAASFMSVSEHYFSELFHKICGMTFSKYLNSVKVKKAVEMLEEYSGEDSITDISIRCGFNTIRHFNRVFKEVTGYSPRSLPKGYRMNTTPIKDATRFADPTLEGSKLLKRRESK